MNEARYISLSLYEIFSKKKNRDQLTLHSLTTEENAFTQKSTRQSSTRRSGNWTLSTLCIGVKWRAASAWTPYWSKVERDRDNQMFLSGHHKAWSDQSLRTSETKQKRKASSTNCLTNLNNYVMIDLKLNRLKLRQFRYATMSRSIVNIVYVCGYPLNIYPPFGGNRVVMVHFWHTRRSNR